MIFVLCVLFTLLWARIAAVFANKAKPATLNRATGIVLVVLGLVIFGFRLFGCCIFSIVLRWRQSKVFQRTEGRCRRAPLMMINFIWAIS